MGNSDQYQRYQQVVQAQSQLYSGGVEEAREWETENAGLRIAPVPRATRPWQNGA